MLEKVLEGGGEPAVSVGGRGLTYGELRECAAAVADADGRLPASLEDLVQHRPQAIG